MIKFILCCIRNFITRNYMRIYSKFHKIENKVLFSSFSGGQYSDNPRAISEKLHELYPEINIVWYIRNREDTYNLIPDYVRIIDNKKLSFYRELATASCFVKNEAMEPNINKRKDQFFVQTWHGDRAIKKILYDAWEEEEGVHTIKVIDNMVTDLCVAGSDFGYNVYRTAFRYNGKILCVGSPRNDKLIIPSKEESLNIKETLQIDTNTKVLLYAPTYRDVQRDQKQEINLNLNLILDKLKEKGEEWICLLRAHSYSKGLNISYDDKNRYKDVTNYPDMADLLCIADFLITDYSSCACDYVLRRKPVVLFIPDKEEYRKTSRSFKADPEQIGFFTCKNTEEILDIIETKTNIDFIRSCDQVNEYYGTKETGHASEIVCNIIYDFIGNHFKNT